MRKFFLLMLAFLFLSAKAQSKDEALPLPDSLAERLQQNRKADEARAEALDKAIMFYVDENRVLDAQLYIRELESLSEELKENYWNALSLYYKSLCAYSNYDFSEFLSLINESLQMTEMQRDTKRTRLLTTRIYLAKSAFCLHINRFAECNEYIERGVKLAEDNSFSQLKNKLLNNYGLLLMRMEKYEEAIIQFKALNPYDVERTGVLLNIAVTFDQLEQYDSVFFYIDSLIHYAQANSESSIVRGNLNKAYGVKAACYMELERWDDAIHCLSLSSEMLEGYEDKNLLAIHNLHLARAYFGKGEYEKSLSAIQESRALSRATQNIENEWLAVKFESDILENMKDYAREVENLRYFIALSDTINNREKLEKIQEQKYQQEALMIEQQYQLQQQTSRQRQQNIIILASVIVVVSILIAILIMLNRKRLAAELELRNREITAKSIGKMQSNEMLNDAIGKLSEMEKHPEKNMLPGVIRDLKMLIDADTKKDFDLHFIQMHPDFYERLLADFPKLTQNELRLCAFVKSNLNIKEIAAINGISAESVKTARKRLRKSLNLTGEDITLLEFLSKY